MSSPACMRTCTGSMVSLTTHSTSKRDTIGSVRSTFSANVREGSYLPPVRNKSVKCQHQGPKRIHQYHLLKCEEDLVKEKTIFLDSVNHLKVFRDVN